MDNDKTDNDASSTPITLRISGLGHNLRITLPSTSSISSLQSQIETQTSIPASYQRLLGRGKDLTDPSQTLATSKIENRTKLILMHNQAYAKDRKGVDTITAINKEINDIASRMKEGDNSISTDTVHELVTQLCCRLDEVDVQGSDCLRKIRRDAIERAESLDRPSGAGN